jgi:error-prone DNA polymerase
VPEEVAVDVGEAGAGSVAREIADGIVEGFQELHGQWTELLGYPGELAGAIGRVVHGGQDQPGRGEELRQGAERYARERGIAYQPPVDHPLLREALGETLGVIIFQDQVLQVCQALASFTAGQAEALRRAMSRKRSRELLEGFWEEFRDGAAKNGVSEETAKKVFEQVVAFSEFGFPKSHAAAFGLLAYQSAWLFHYHPVEYYAALFNNQPMGFYSIDALGRDAVRHGVNVLLPNINRSDVWCTVEDGAVRVGLGFIREWSEEHAQAVVEERERHGPYRSLSDIARRAPVGLTRNAFDHLVWVGACDDFGLTRRELLWQVGLWLGPKEDRDPRRVRRQLELPLNHPHDTLRFGGVDASERLLAEYAVLGFAASGHPLSLLGDALPPHAVKSARDGERDRPGGAGIAGGRAGKRTGGQSEPGSADRPSACPPVRLLSPSLPPRRRAGLEGLGVIAPRP